MACTDAVCGTGGWTGPLPGDPDNFSTHISAVGIPGGVEITWTYPTLNAFAVSYFVLYRGTTANFISAVEYAMVGGNSYFDRIAETDLQQYYYWIEIVSINGTRGYRIGPASAIPLSFITKIMQDLTGQIDAGVLAQSLRAEIDRISIISGNLEGETAERVAAGALFSEAMAAVQGDTDQMMTYINSEIAARTTADQAIVTSVNTLAVGVNNNAAAILEQQTVSTAADAALASDIDLLYARVDTADAAVVSETTARAAADAVLAAQITTAQTTLAGNIASAQTTLQTNINVVDGKATAIGARYTAVVDVNGLIGGFGVYNDGTSVEAGFDVDRFWVGRTVNKVKPFIIDGTTVYINNAMIQSASIGTAKIMDAAITNAKIANLSVDTLKIQGNAVTLPVFFEDGSTTPLVYDSGAGVYQQLLMQSTLRLGVGSTSLVFVTVLPFNITGGNHTVTLRVTVDSGYGEQTISTFQAGATNNVGGSPITWFCKDIYTIPSQDTDITYRVYGNQSGDVDGWGFYFRKLMVLGCKR